MAVKSISLGKTGEQTIFKPKQKCTSFGKFIKRFFPSNFCFKFYNNFFFLFRFLFICRLTVGDVAVLLAVCAVAFVSLHLFLLCLRVYFKQANCINCLQLPVKLKHLPSNWCTNYMQQTLLNIIQFQSASFALCFQFSMLLPVA